MPRITTAAVEACLAYGAASLAVMEARAELERSGSLETEVAAARDELLSAHLALGELLSHGADDTVPGMALSVMVLADRTLWVLGVLPRD